MSGRRVPLPRHLRGEAARFGEVSVGPCLSHFVLWTDARWRRLPASRRAIPRQHVEGLG